MLLAQNCNKICGNMIGLLHRILICFALQPVSCVCIAGQKARVVIDLFAVVCRPINFTFFIFLV